VAAVLGAAIVGFVGYLSTSRAEVQIQPVVA
jgi:hypothetical protein